MVQIQVADNDQFLNYLLNHKSSSPDGSANMSDSFQESSDSHIDCDTLVKDSDNEIQ